MPDILERLMVLSSDSVLVSISNRDQFDNLSGWSIKLRKTFRPDLFAKIAFSDTIEVFRFDVPQNHLAQAVEELSIKLYGYDPHEVILQQQRQDIDDDIPF